MIGPAGDYPPRPSGVESVRAIGFGENALQRNLRGYLLILRERLWYVVVVFIVVFLASLVYTLDETKQYTASASIELLARDPVVMKVQEVRDNDMHTPEDLNTQVKLLESGAIVQKVADSLTPDETKALLAPFQKGKGDDPGSPEEILANGRRVLPVRMTRVLNIVFTHPDPDVAANIANHFTDAFIDYNIRWRVDESMRAVEDLKVRADEQAKKVEELGNELEQYREQHNMISLDQRKDIVTEKLKALNSALTDANSRLTSADVRWKQVQDCQNSGGNLADLAFIASNPIVQHLLQEIDTDKVTIADLSQRYRAKWPKMRESVETLDQAQTELAQELKNAAATVENEHETAQRDVEQTKNELAAQELEAVKLDRLSVDYDTEENELNVNKELLASIMTRMRETSMNANIEFQNARVVDRAGRPRRPSSPNLTLNLGMGAMGGLGLGLALAFFVAYVDDRVKSAYQVESLVGYPLIGVIPRVPKLAIPERAQIVANNSNPLAAESFLTVHSNLRLKPEAKDAKVLIVTSTKPGEGKSFVASNLALTFAKHSERTLLIDCDLRKPNVHAAFGLPNNRGLIDCCAGDAPFDEVVVRQKAAQLDVLTSGGRAHNPTAILNDPSFPRFLAEMRQRYDRIIIDTPPLSPVSDAMIVLSHADGAIFVVRFKDVRVRGAQFCARRLRESQVPCFGAILNGLDVVLKDYYYSEYYDRSYSAYASNGSLKKP